VELLIKPNSAVLSAHTHTPLKAATYAHSLKGVELLIKAGADVNAGHPLTALMLAAIAGYTNCIKCLLKAGADANIPDNNGTVPVEIAAIQGCQECVEILFPVTTPLARVADWSIGGITQYAKLTRSSPQVWVNVQILEFISCPYDISDFQLSVLFRIICSRRMVNLILRQMVMPHSLKGIMLVR